jgi:hypothetical protein
MELFQLASPHFLPIYVPTKLVMSKTTHQTILQGFNSLFVKDVKKNLFFLTILCWELQYFKF